jgi:hypothetical protein
MNLLITHKLINASATTEHCEVLQPKEGVYFLLKLPELFDPAFALLSDLFADCFRGPFAIDKACPAVVRAVETW